MTRCAACHNDLHHHCMSVWADSLRLNGEAVCCPLCRHPWEVPAAAMASVGVSTPALHAASASVPLPAAPPVDASVHPAATPWMAQFGDDLVACLFSREWAVREAALRRLIALLFARLEAADSVADSTLHSVAGMLEMAAHDPVLRVYSAALAVLPVFTAMRSTHLKAFVRPVVLAVLARCGDINERVRSGGLSQSQPHS